MANHDITLVFDFNNLAMRSLFTCAYAGGKESVPIRDFSTSEELGVFIRKLAIDMSYVIRAVSPNRVIVCCDDRYPWRYKLLADASTGYKGTRHKDETKDWDAIFRALNEYKKILKKQNIIVYEIPNAEADDLAAFVKKDIFKIAHDDIIYVSSDKDWLQLVDFDETNKCFCAVMNPIMNSHKKRPLNVSEEFTEWLNSEDSSNSVENIFFINADKSKEQVKNLVMTAGVEIVTIDPDQVLLSKLFCGDQSDNVPSLYEFYKNGRLSRITASKMKKIVDNFSLKNGKDFIRVAKTPEFKEYVEGVIKHEIDDADLAELASRQRLLVELDPDLFPDPVCENYEYMSNNISETGRIQVGNVKMEKLLEGTQYYDKNYIEKARRSDVFGDIKELDKFIKPKSIVNELF